MNEQLQNTMNDAATVLIEKAMSGLDSATGFLQAEIPEYVYQLMLWYGVKSVVVGTVCLLISSMWAYFLVIKPAKSIATGVRNEEENFWVDHNGAAEGHCVLLIFNIFIAIPIIIFMSKFLVALQIWIAPKVWLVEYASTLIK